MKMNIYQKFGLSFILALSLHLMIFGAFGINLADEAELIKQKPLPEIIQASILDDHKIQQEAERLKTNEENKRIAQDKRQQNLENKRKKEQKLLADAKKKRQQEQKTAKALVEKHKKQAIVEQRKLEKIKQQKVIEAARLAKIKQQKSAEISRLAQIKQKNLLEKKRLADLKKAEVKKREQARQALIEKQQYEAAEKAAKLQKQAQAAQAKIAQDKKTTTSVTAAIQHKVNSKWIRPLSSVKGLRCTIRVKLLPTGDVMDAQVIKGSGDSAFDNSAENAVRKASPLPVPKSRTLFGKNFRTFTFNFNPK